MADRPMSVPEAALIVQVPRSTLYFWIKRGEVKAERSPGGRMRVRESEAIRIRNWLTGEDVEHP